MEQSLTAEDQLEYNGVEVHSRTKLFNGKQCIIAKNSKTAKPFKINLGWDGSSKCILTADPTKEDLKTLPHIHLTSKGSYDPQKELKKLKANCIVSSRNHAFEWARHCGRKLKWTPEQLVEWKKPLNYYSSECIKKTFEATTQLYLEITSENQELSKNFYRERFHAFLGVP